MRTGSSIDLVKGKSSLGDNVITWALGFGRFLIIAVEIVAFSAFIYRFVLDRELVDLNDKIREHERLYDLLRKNGAKHANEL